MSELSNLNKLTIDFYRKDVLTVAEGLLGKIFVKAEKNVILAGKIVEVEAYNGVIDEAAHSFRGKTKRNEVMFNKGGLLYVYFTYGVHYCCNVVTGEQDEGNAVLIRGIEPVSGIDIMAGNRFKKGSDFKIENIANGPGKICKAFNINLLDNGVDLTGDYIYILDNVKIPENRIVKTKRIGITKSADLPWRFYIKENGFVSKK